ncbi:hypothetical protein Hanom_Chr06g00495151 [Helianthus anomalus]
MRLNLLLFNHAYGSKISFRFKCHFSPCCLGHFASLVQMFHFSYVGPKRFHRCHFSLLG